MSTSATQLLGGRTLTEVATAVGMTKSGLCRIVNGDRNVTLAKAVELAHVLEMPLDRLAHYIGQAAINTRQSAA